MLRAATVPRSFNEKEIRYYFEGIEKGVK